MEYLPIEILQVEIGKYLDLSGLISMSLVNQSMLEIYQPRIRQLVLKIDPFASKTTIYDLLNMMRMATLESFVFKIYRFLIHNIISEMNNIYPYLSRDKIIQIFVQVVPQDAIQEVKSKIQFIILHSKTFFVYRNVVYRDYLIQEEINFSRIMEHDLMDIIDPLMHELSEFDGQSPSHSLEDRSDHSFSTESDQVVDYFCYENIMDSMDQWISNL